MKRWSIFSAIGRERRREGFHPIGLKRAREWFDTGKLFFDETLEPNSRKAHCKVCGAELAKGEGEALLIYAPNWYNLSFYYCHPACKQKVIENGKTQKETN